MLGLGATVPGDAPGAVRLADCRRIEQHQSLIVTGPCGSGKSFIASALGQQACIMGYRVLYWPASKLFAQLKLAKADGSYLRELGKIARRELLAIDAFGLEALDGASRIALLGIREERGWLSVLRTLAFFVGIRTSRPPALWILPVSCRWPMVVVALGHAAHELPLPRPARVVTEEGTQHLGEGGNRLARGEAKQGCSFAYPRKTIAKLRHRGISRVASRRASR